MEIPESFDDVIAPYRARSVARERLRRWGIPVVVLVTIPAVVAWYAGPVVPRYWGAYEEYSGDIYSKVTGSETVPFSTLTEFEWETVTVFDAYNSDWEMERVIGRDFLNFSLEDSSPTHVYCADGAIVHIVRYAAGLDATPTEDWAETYSHDVLWGPHPGGGHAFAEPGGRVVTPACGGSPRSE